MLAEIGSGTAGECRRDAENQVFFSRKTLAMTFLQDLRVVIVARKGKKDSPSKDIIGGRRYKETAQGNDQEMIGQAEDDILRRSKGHGARRGQTN